MTPENTSSMPGDDIMGTLQNDRGFDTALYLLAGTTYTFTSDPMLDAGGDPLEIEMYIDTDAPWFDESVATPDTDGRTTLTFTPTATGTYILVTSESAGRPGSVTVQISPPLTAVNDTLSGDTGNDVLFGGAGDDEISGAQGNDTLYGGTQNDTVYGNSGDDSLYGNTGDDNILGGAGLD